MTFRLQNQSTRYDYREDKFLRLQYALQVVLHDRKRFSFYNHTCRLTRLLGISYIRFIPYFYICIYIFFLMNIDLLFTRFVTSIFDKKKLLDLELIGKLRAGYS